MSYPLETYLSSKASIHAPTDVLRVDDATSSLTGVAWAVSTACAIAIAPRFARRPRTSAHAPNSAFTPATAHGSHGNQADAMPTTAPSGVDGSAAAPTRSAIRAHPATVPQSTTQTRQLIRNFLKLLPSVKDQDQTHHDRKADRLYHGHKLRHLYLPSMGRRPRWGHWARVTRTTERTRRRSRSRKNRLASDSSSPRFPTHSRTASMSPARQAACKASVTIRSISVLLMVVDYSARVIKTSSFRAPEYANRPSFRHTNRPTV